MENIYQEEAQKTAMRMMEGKFDLNDLLSQIRQINKMGDIKGIMKMIPGISKMKDKIDAAGIDNKMIKHQEAIILSMTPYERKYPEVLKAARKARIAAGSGTSPMEVNRLLKQYEQMAKVMKQFKKMGPMGMMKMMGGLKGMMGGGSMPGGFGGMGGFGSAGGMPDMGAMPDLSALQNSGGLNANGLPNFGGGDINELMKQLPKK